MNIENSKGPQYCLSKTQKSIKSYMYLVCIKNWNLPTCLYVMYYAFIRNVLLYISRFTNKSFFIWSRTSLSLGRFLAMSSILSLKCVIRPCIQGNESNQGIMFGRIDVWLEWLYFWGDIECQVWVTGTTSVFKHVKDWQFWELFQWQ